MERIKKKKKKPLPKQMTETKQKPEQTMDSLIQETCYIPDYIFSNMLPGWVGAHRLDPYDLSHHILFPHEHKMWVDEMLRYCSSPFCRICPPGLSPDERMLHARRHFPEDELLLSHISDLSLLTFLRQQAKTDSLADQTERIRRLVTFALESQKLYGSYLVKSFQTLLRRLEMKLKAQKYAQRLYGQVSRQWPLPPELQDRIRDFFPIFPSKKRKT